MRKFLILLSGILFITGSAFAIGSVEEVDADGSQLIDEELPKAQMPDIENKLAAKKAAVHAKAEAKNTELGVKKDVTLSSLGISETKVHAVPVAGKATAAGKKAASAQKASEDKTKEKVGDTAKAESDELEMSLDEELENAEKDIAEEETTASKSEDEKTKDIEEETTANKSEDEKTNDIDEETTASKSEDEKIKDIDEENTTEISADDEKAQISKEEPVFKEAETEEKQEKNTEDAGENESVLDDIDDI